VRAPRSPRVIGRSTDDRSDAAIPHHEIFQGGRGEAIFMPELTRQVPMRGTPAEAPRNAATFFRSDQDDYELHLTIPGPGSPLVAAMNQGPAEFALVIEEPEVILLFRFGEGFPWTAALFDRFGGPNGRASYHARESVDPPERPAHVDVFLIDAASRAVLATRCSILWLDFTRRLDAAIRDQARIAFDPSVRRRTLARFDQRFARLETLAMHAKVRSPGCA